MENCIFCKIANGTAPCYKIYEDELVMAFLDVNIIAAVFAIGVITFAISALGVKIGNIFGDKYEKKAELAGGIVLVLIGLKILLEHLGILVL